MEHEESQHPLGLDGSSDRALIHLQGAHGPQHPHPLELLESMSIPLGVEDRGGSHTEDSGRHVGPLNEPADPPHPIGGVARHGRLEHTVESTADLDDSPEEPVAARSTDRVRALGAGEPGELVDRGPCLSWHHLAGGAQVLPSRFN